MSKHPVHEFVCTKRRNGRTARRIVSILISSALAYTDSEMELNRILFSCLERTCGRCELRRVLDQYFNVCLGVSGREMESLERVVLNLTGCYEQTVNVYFYLLFVFTSWWRALLTGRHIRR